MTSNSACSLAGTLIMAFLSLLVLYAATPDRDPLPTPRRILDLTKYHVIVTGTDYKMLFNCGCAIFRKKSLQKVILVPFYKILRTLKGKVTKYCEMRIMEYCEIGHYKTCCKYVL